MKLSGRVAVVTGGGAGIGRAICRRFASEGAKVAVNAVRMEAAQATLDLLDGPEKGMAVVADVSDSRAVAAMFAQVERGLGPIDILVNNAGIRSGSAESAARFERNFNRRREELATSGQVQTPLDAVTALSDGEWARMLAVHLTGTFYCTREVLRFMIPRRRGSIINMSSTVALTGIDVAPEYSAAKAGIIGFTRAVAREVGLERIRVNAICPGFIETAMMEAYSEPLKAMITGVTPLGRFGSPEEVSGLAAYLASDDASFVTGQSISPNGGLHLS
jgi:3-oxoacyl-[acyl-carrier protein] reductase